VVVVVVVVVVQGVVVVVVVQGVVVVCKNWQYCPLNPSRHWQTAIQDILKQIPLLAHGLLAHGSHGVVHGAAVVVWRTWKEKGF
jgi:hypothetical protein